MQKNNKKGVDRFAGFYIYIELDCPFENRPSVMEGKSRKLLKK